MIKIIFAIAIFLTGSIVQAKDINSYLLQLSPTDKAVFLNNIKSEGTITKDLNFNGWISLDIDPDQAHFFSLSHFSKMEGVIHAQPNYAIYLNPNPSIFKILFECPPGLPKPICDIIGGGGGGGQKPPPREGSPAPVKGDNPDFPKIVSNPSGPDPHFPKQWGMNDIGVSQFVTSIPVKEIIVGVIDTGVDYTHEDLVENLWRNPGETGTDASGKDKSTNGVDDDNNGYIDDVVGWDFSSNDNKPYDLKARNIFSGNPGHGTHVAGAVAARGNNSIGVTGVAPRAKIMALRFISQKGQGTTKGAILAIKYAVDNGAHITNNSWGSEGEDPGDAEGNKALRDAIQYAQDNGRLFVTAAGNGHQGKGYNNDADSKPAYPASYPHDAIISVAAIDSSDRLASFSNWGSISVDIAAPGVKVYSTIVGNDYTDTAAIGATWDGTSMSAPHVAGAAALYWGQNPDKTWQEVKAAILNSAKPIASAQGKMTSNGKLDVIKLMQ